MNNTPRVVALIVMLTMGLIAMLPTAYAKVYVEARDQALLYTGRIKTNSTGAYLTWPGSSVTFAVTGDTLILDISDDKGNNYFNIVVNNEANYPLVLELKKGRHTYDISHVLSEDNSTLIELFKRTEGHEGGSTFHGFSVDAAQSLQKRPAGKARKIAFFGDSVTSGMGNEAPTFLSDKVLGQKNHYLSYASIAARALNAEHHSISVSGIGFMVSWFDHTMPEVYDQLSGVGNNDTTWDFRSWTPDLVVVNLGQNDSWLIDNEKRVQPEPTPALISRRYADFVLTLMQHYPEAQFLCVLGSMDIVSKEHWKQYVRNAVKLVKAQQPKARIDTLFFGFSGYKKHPRVFHHAQNAKALVTKISSLTGWTTEEKHQPVTSR